MIPFDLTYLIAFQANSGAVIFLRKLFFMI